MIAPTCGGGLRVVGSVLDRDGTLPDLGHDLVGAESLRDLPRIHRDAPALPLPRSPRRCLVRWLWQCDEPYSRAIR